MPSTYMLVQTSSGSVEDVVAQISALDQVEYVDPVTGPYDAIVAVNGGIEDIEPVRTKLSQIDDVTTSLTCVAAAQTS